MAMSGCYGRRIGILGMQSEFRGRYFHIFTQ